MYNIQYNKKRRIFIGIAVLILVICLLLIIHQLLANKNYASNTININYYGGTISLAEYITCETEEGLQKKGWDQFTDEELENMTISYEAGEVAVNFQPNKEYVIFLKYIEEKEGYFVFGDGYGARELSEDGKMYNLDTKTFDTKLTELN